MFQFIGMVVSAVATAVSSTEVISGAIELGAKMLHVSRPVMNVIREVGPNVISELMTSVAQSVLGPRGPGECGGACTEYQPCATPTVPTGYAESGDVKRLREYKDSLEAIATHFADVEVAGAFIKWHDSVFGLGDLEAIANGPYDPQLKKAAQFLLSNRDLFSTMEKNIGNPIEAIFGGDGLASLANVQEALKATKAALFDADGTRARGTGAADGDGHPRKVGPGVQTVPAQTVVTSTKTKTAAAPKAAQTEKKDTESSDEGSATKGKTTSSKSSSQNAKSVLTDPHLSIDQKVSIFLEGMVTEADDDILNAMEDMEDAKANAAKLKDKKASAEEIAKAENLSSRLSLRLQNLVESRKRMFDLVSTMSLKFHEMSATSIHNMARA